ncbi:MAG TPA: OmpA family protein [Polyangia bacterium]|jgi:chemotaxis protein MotB
MRKLCALGLGLLFSVGCGPGWDQYNAKVTELQNTKKQFDDHQKKCTAEQKLLEVSIQSLKETIVKLKDRLAGLGQDMSKLEAERGGLAEDLAATKRRMEELKRAQMQAEARLQQFRNLLSKFKAMIDSGKLQVSIRNGKMTVKLPEGILFPSGKADLKPEGQAAIEQVTDILKAIENRSFQVAGHTDNIPMKSGRYKSNWELSTARALAVVKVMIERGMAPKRVSAAGFAETDPVESNEATEGRAKNRRIEIVLLPNIEELPSMDDLLKDTGQAAAPSAPPP